MISLEKYKEYILKIHKNYPKLKKIVIKTTNDNIYHESFITILDGAVLQVLNPENFKDNIFYTKGKYYYEC